MTLVLSWVNILDCFCLPSLVNYPDCLLLSHHNLQAINF